MSYELKYEKGDEEMSFINRFFGAFFAVVIQLSSLIGISCFVNDNPAAQIDFENGGDPFIVEDNGNTYYTFTTGGGIDIRKIAAFDDAAVIEQKTVYWAGNDGIISQIWAPEIHKIGDRWYIVACALFDKNSTEAGTMPEADKVEDHDDYYRYGFVLESKTEDIFGEYEFKGRLAPDGLNNIDGTYLQKDGKLYYVCSAYVDVAHQCIYIAEMENPYTLKTDENGKDNAVMLSRPQYKWEKNGWYVNEGPAVLYKDNNIYIVYSASGYSSGEYCLGILTLLGDNVMSKYSWAKSPVKVFGKNSEEKLYHTGHCSFLYRENGDVYMAFHATDNEDFFAVPRHTYIKKLEFKSGYPLF